MPSLDDLDALEALSRRLEPDRATREQLLAEVAGEAEAFLERMRDAPAYGPGDDPTPLYDAAIGDEGIGTAAALELLRDHVFHTGVNATSGRFFGFIPGGGLYHSALGDYLAAVSNRYAGVFFGGRGSVRVENQLVRWMADLAGYPDGASGYLASGGSLANLTAIVTARDAAGVEGAEVERAVVYTTDHTHHCVDKALNIAGLRRAKQRRIAVDDRYRMDPAALESAIREDEKAGRRPWLVIASAGTTNTGTVDPIEPIGQIAAAHDLWYHVDGAYGAFFALCPEGAELLTGMDRSDSLVLDPHKTLFLPYGVGAVVVRRGELLRAAHTEGADYMQDTVSAIEETSPSDVSPELTKHFRGLRLWLPLQVLGLAPFRAALSEKIQLTRYFHERIESIDGFEVGPRPDLSVATYRYVPERGDANHFNERLLHAVNREGRVFITSTKLDGNFVLRLAVVCFRSHRTDVDEAIEALERNVAKLLQEGAAPA